MQLTDSNGNIYGVGGLEITGIDGKPKVPVIPAMLIVNSTPITGGAVGRILFQGTGNVLQQSGNLFWDQVNNRLGVGTSTPTTSVDIFGINELLQIGDGTAANPSYISFNGTRAQVGYKTTGLHLLTSSGRSLVFGSGSFASTTEWGRFVATTGNLLINTITDSGFRVDINGTTRTQGLLTATGGITSNIVNYNMSVSANQSFYNDTTKVIQSPATWIWHDLFAFNRLPVTYETYNGTTWSAATANLELFAQKQSQSINIISTTVLGSRWTFSSTDWGGGQWLTLGIAYAASLASVTILFESWNGTTWTTRHTSSVNNQTTNAFCYVTAYSGDSQLRLTITKTGGGNDLNLSNIRFLTARPGDQGGGMELESPIYWNGTRNVGIGNVALSNSRLVVGGAISASSLLGAGARIINTIAATANNDVLVGLDINPTFTTGAFTGTTSAALRVNGNIIPLSGGGASLGTATLPFNNGLFLGTVFSNNIQAYSSHLNFLTTSFTTVGRFFSGTGNLTLQNGGTFTDIASARLAVNSTTQGVLIPRMTSTERDAIASPAIGLQIFNTTTSCVEYFDTFWGWMPVNANSQWYASYGIDYFSDGIGSDDIIFNAASGTGAGVNSGANVLGKGQGTGTFITGTTSTGFAGCWARSYYVLGGGRIVNEYGLTFAQLSVSADRYYGICGFFDVVGNPNQVDGVYFLYDNFGITSGSTATPNWQCVTSSNSVRTFTTTSVVVGSYAKLRIEINDNATQVLFYINGTLVATHTTNIPSGTSRNAQWGSIVQKQVGTTSLQTFVVDYYAYRQKFTTPR